MKHQNALSKIITTATTVKATIRAVSLPSESSATLAASTTTGGVTGFTTSGTGTTVSSSIFKGTYYPPVGLQAVSRKIRPRPVSPAFVQRPWKPSKRRDPSTKPIAARCRVGSEALEIVGPNSCFSTLSVIVILWMPRPGK